MHRIPTIATNSGELQCPRCASNKLRQKTITVYMRLKSANQTRITVLDEGESCTRGIRSSSEVNNPSLHENGLAIAFWCEKCSTQAELTFAQSGDNVQLGWRKA